MLGQIFEQPNQQGGPVRITGKISTYKLAIDFILEPETDRRTDASPTHSIKAKSPVHGGYFHAGAAWQGETNGQRRFGLSIELPDLDVQMDLVAFESKSQAGTFDIVQSKKKPAQQEQEAA